MNATEIRTLRRKLGITQEEFAERIGTVQQTVSMWESGTKPRRMATWALTNLAREYEHDIRFIDEPEPTYDAG